MISGGLLSEDAVIDHALNHGVVLGQLHQGVAAQQIDAAVANVRDVSGALIDQHCDDGAAHAAQVEAFLGGEPDVEVGLFDGSLERFGDRRALHGAQRALHLVDGHLAGGGSAGVATHPVCDDEEQSERGQIMTLIVLVLTALDPDVGQGYIREAVNHQWFAPSQLNPCHVLPAWSTFASPRDIDLVFDMAGDSK